MYPYSDMTNRVHRPRQTGPPRPGKTGKEGSKWRKKQALIVWGGWDGHEPDKVAARFQRILENEGLEVCVSDTLDAFADAERLMGLHLIVPIWTGAICRASCAVTSAEPSPPGRTGRQSRRNVRRLPRERRMAVYDRRQLGVASGRDYRLHRGDPQKLVQPDRRGNRGFSRLQRAVLPARRSGH